MALPPFTTIAEWLEYANSRGEPIPRDAENAPDPENAAGKAALARATDYIEIHYYNRVLDEYKTDPPREDLVAALARSTAIIASEEFAFPNSFATSDSSTTSTSQDSALLALGDLRFAAPKNTTTTETATTSAEPPITHNLVEEIMRPFLMRSKPTLGIAVRS